MKYEINTSIPITFEKIEDIDNLRFTRAKCWICHTQENLNGSFMSKEFIENELMPSLPNIPVLGYIKLDNYNEADFSGHEQILIMDSEGVSIKYCGRAYGVVPQDNNTQFETKVCEDGIEREFMTSEVLLWNKFQECIDIFDRDDTKGHSMELTPSTVEGKFDKDGLFHFSKAKMDGLCILGDSVTAAMRGSLIEKFSTSSINNQLIEMLKEFNENYSISTNFNTKGGNDLPETVLSELLQKYSLTKEQVLKFDSKINFEEISAEDLEIKLQEFTKIDEVIEPEVKVEDVVEPKSIFSLTNVQLEEEVRKILSEKVVIKHDWWGDAYESQEYYYRDIKDDVVIVIDNDWASYYGIPFVVNEDVVILDFENMIPYMADWRPKVEGDVTFSFEIFDILKERALAKTSTSVEPVIESIDTTEFTVKIESLEKENKELKEFKLGVEKQEKLNLVDKFTELTDEEKAVFVESIDTYSLEDLEIKLFAEIGKKKINFNENKVKPANLIFSIPKTTSGEQPAWVGLVEQYKAKNSN